MSEASDPSQSKVQHDFLAYAAEARTAGAVRIDTPGGEIFVVAPRHRTSSAPAPFANAQALLQLPLARAAYSDRTAWLMAVLSQLAYEPFEKGADARTSLTALLADAGLFLVDTFDVQKSGTQGFLVRRPGDFSALVFRGTEKDREDIVADLNARFYETPDGKAHEGFAAAYQSVHGSIVAALDELKDVPAPEQLFIAGHSLGGALATVAAQELEETRLVAACYTFGSPRVGTEEWSDAVKTPIYRVVNGADGVPLVPGSIVTRWVLTTLPNLPGLTWLQRPVEKFVSSGYVGFQHVGDLRFLQGEIGGAKLKIGSAASWARFRHITLERIVGAIRSMSPRYLRAFFADHAISQYVGKLRRIAEARNL